MLLLNGNLSLFRAARADGRLWRRNFYLARNDAERGRCLTRADEAMKRAGQELSKLHFIPDIPMCRAVNHLAVKTFKQVIGDNINRRLLS